MRVAVVVASYARPQLLGRMLAQLEGQTRLPDVVVVSVSEAAHAPDIRAARYRLLTVVGASGLCAQRNRALDEVLPWADIVTFFDDDFIPANTYLETVEQRFRAMPDVAAIMGHAEVDGARGAGLTFDEGVMILRAIEQSPRLDLGPADHVGTYGCNMSIRASVIGDARFDERLVLYGWQEDIDFSSRLRPHGRIVGFRNLVGVHLGFREGRVSGVRFGYSQVVNPTYLIRKGTVPASFGLNLMARNIAANLVGSLWPEPTVDRRGRLKGNLIGALHLLRGRIEPEHILKL